MRVLVCGGRDFADTSLLADEMAKLHRETPIATVIHGGAAGADRSVGGWPASPVLDHV